jgi:hypothetical protein
VLVWPRPGIADHRALKDEVSSATGRLSGVVRVGVIPSGVALSARVLAELCATHADLQVRVITGLTSEQVVAGLRAFELDTGLLHPSAAADEIRHIPVETDIAHNGGIRQREIDNSKILACCSRPRGPVVIDA